MCGGDKDVSNKLTIFLQIVGMSVKFQKVLQIPEANQTTDMKHINSTHSTVALHSEGTREI